MIHMETCSRGKSNTSERTHLLMYYQENIKSPRRFPMNDGNDKNKNKKVDEKKPNNSKQVAEAEKVWNSLQKQIKHLAEKIIRFNSSYTIEDYVNEAYLACYDAVCRYDSYVAKKKKEHAVNQKAKGWNSEVLSNHNCPSQPSYRIIQLEKATQVINKTIMKIDVFAFWFVQKRFFKLADMNEVVFNVFSKDGEFIETLTNSEYRKKKKDLNARTCSVAASNIVRSIDHPYEETDEDKILEFVDFTFMGFKEEVQEMLEEDISRLKVGVRI